MAGVTALSGDHYPAIVVIRPDSAPITTIAG